MTWIRQLLTWAVWAVALLVGGTSAALGVTHLLAEIGRRVRRDDLIDVLIKERGAKS